MPEMYVKLVDMNQEQLNQMTKKDIIFLLSKMKCKLVGGKIVKADQFDFKKWEKAKVIEHYLGCVKQKENGELVEMLPADDIECLDVLLQKGVMNDNLRKAIEATKQALIDGDFVLACNLSAVKSLICPHMNCKKDAFEEGWDQNEKHLGQSIYRTLDYMHFELAKKTDSMPSGMMIISANGMRTRQQSKSDHPIIKLMNQELDRIRKGQ